MRLLVTGDREWDDGQVVCDALQRCALAHPGRRIVLIEGEARGADRWSAVVGALLGFTVEPYPAEWGRYGRAAGPIRNQQMLAARPDEAIAFHDDLAHSRGTRDMVGRLLAAGVPTTLVTRATPGGMRLSSLIGLE